jgi:hypothetical protein
MKSRILNIILIIIIIILFWKGCEYSKEKKQLVSQISNYELVQKGFETKMLKDSTTIATQSQTILTQEDAIKLGVIKLNDKIKKATSQVTETQVIKVDSVFMPFIPRGYMDTLEWISKFKNGDKSKEVIDSLIANSIIVPQIFSTKSKWFRIYGKVKKNGVLMDSIRLVNESSVTIGYKKKGFLNLKNEPIVEIKNTNPFLGVTKMDNVVIKEKKTILQSKLFWLGIGILGGLFVNKL